MARPDTPKPAPAAAGNPASKIDRFAGEIDAKITLTDLRAQRLNRRFGFAYETAIAISTLAFAVSR